LSFLVLLLDAVLLVSLSTARRSVITITSKKTYATLKATAQLNAELIAVFLGI
jgi:hypothetical protein